MTKVLFVITAADRWMLNDGEVHPSGFWAEEVAMPFKIFTEAGYEITVAAPGGKKPTLDPLSLSLKGGSAPWKVGGIKKYLESIADRLNNPEVLADMKQEEYDLVFYPGGHKTWLTTKIQANYSRIVSHRVDLWRCSVMHPPSSWRLSMRTGRYLLPASV